jgi:hypothetical protein
VEAQSLLIAGGAAPDGGGGRAPHAFAEACMILDYGLREGECLRVLALGRGVFSRAISYWPDWAAIMAKSLAHGGIAVCVAAAEAHATTAAAISSAKAPFAAGRAHQDWPCPGAGAVDIPVV